MCACVRTGFEGTADLPLRSRRQTRSAGLTFELFTPERRFSVSNRAANRLSNCFGSLLLKIINRVVVVRDFRG